MAMILLIGGADTGRAPMAAALLRRLLEARGLAWPVESAGVLGHDGDPAEVEARDTMAHMGLDISTHRARMLTDDLVVQAALLLAIDSGTALVLRSRFPVVAARVHTLGDLAGRRRDIPDPFRMQIGAWMTYAREIEALLTAALPRIIELMAPTVEGRATTLRRQDDAGPAVHPAGAEALPAAQSLAERAAAAGRITRLLHVAAELPGVVDWAAARTQIEANLHQIAAAPYDASDLVAAYVGLLHAALALTPAPPSAGQMERLREATRRLADPIGQDELNDLSTRLAGWAAL